jgi:hypothetical protein
VEYISPQFKRGTKEEALINEISSSDDLGQILEISSIKKHYEKLAGKQVHKTVIYRIRIKKKTLKHYSKLVEIA